MRIVRFQKDAYCAYGIVENDVIHEISGKPYNGIIKTGKTFSLQDMKLLPPVEPEKIIGVGLNYMDHITSQGLTVPETPYIVHRPLNTLNAHNNDVYGSMAEHFVQFEGELVVVIGRECHNVDKADAKNYVFGYTVGNDVTDKDYYKRDKHFGIAKAFDTQCPIGPWVETDYNWHHKTIHTEINGAVRQHGSTDDMVFDCDELVSFLSHVMTLRPGDVIMTGSPSGVGRINDGDRISITVEGVGTLTNTMKENRKSEE